MPRPGQSVQSPSGVDVGVPPEDVVPHHVDDARRPVAYGRSPPPMVETLKPWCRCRRSYRCRTLVILSSEGVARVHLTVFPIVVVSSFAGASVEKGVAQVHRKVALIVIVSFPRLVPQPV